MWCKTTEKSAEYFLLHNDALYMKTFLFLFTDCGWDIKRGQGWTLGQSWEWTHHFNPTLGGYDLGWGWMT